MANNNLTPTPVTNVLSGAAAIVSAAMKPASPFDFASTAQSIHADVDGATAAIPAGHDTAFLLKGVTADGKPGVQAIFATKFNDQWSFVTGATWSGGNHVDGEVALVGSWTTWRK